MSLRLVFNPITGKFDYTVDENSLSGSYLKLDCSNDPLTGDLEINKTNPEFKITTEDTQSSRITRVTASNELSVYNKLKVITDEIPTMSSNTAPSGTASVSSYYLNSDTYNAWRTMDKNTGTLWVTNVFTGSAHWLQYQFPTARIITKYAITPRQDYYLHAFSTYSLRGSNDGTNWTVLDTQNGLVWSNPHKKYFDITNTSSYTHYILTGSSAGGYVGISEWELFAGGNTGSITEFEIMSSKDLVGEGGVNTFGVSGTKTVIDGGKIGINISGSEKAAIDNTGRFLINANLTASNISSSNITASNLVTSLLTASNVTCSTNLSASTIKSGGNVLIGTTAATEMFSGFGAQNNNILELNQPIAITSASFPQPVLILANKQTSAEYSLATINWANSAITTSEKRLGLIGVATETNISSSNMRLYTTKNGTITEKMRIDSNGTVGIGGAATPHTASNCKLEVKGTQAVNAMPLCISTVGAWPVGQGNGIQFRDANGHVGHIQVSYDGTNSNMYFGGFYGGGYGSVASHTFMLKGNGNVGIATTDPTYKLHVNGDITSSNIITNNITASTITTSGNVVFGSSNGWQMGVWPVNTNFAYLQNSGLLTTSSNYALLQQNDGATFLNAASGSSVSIGANNGQIANINAVGMGLGITASDHIFEVNGQMAFTLNGAVRSKAGYNALQGNTQVYIDCDIANGGNGNDIIFRGINSTEKMRMLSDGKFGIGTTAAANKLHVYSTGNADGIAIDGNTNPALQLKNAGTTKCYIGLATAENAYFTGAKVNDTIIRNDASNIQLGYYSVYQTPTMTLDTNSRVGIGTIIPAYTLDVNGNARFGSTSSSSMFDSTGHQTMTGSARPWRDERNDAINIKVQGTGAAVNTTELTVDFPTTTDLNDYLYLNIQLNHDRDNTAIISPHIHWFQNQNAVPNWLVQYRWQVNGAAKQANWSSSACTTSAFTYSSGTIHQICDTADITPPTNSTISDIVQFKIFRDNDNDSTVFTSSDLYTGSVAMLAFDVHVQINSLGSTDEYVK